MEEKQDKELLLHQLTHYLFQREEILFAYCFGSFLDEGNYQDIDVGIYVDESRVPPARFFEYSLDLATFLTIKLHQSVDVRIVNQAPVGFRVSVLKGECLFTRDEELLEGYIEANSFDYMQFRRHIFEELR